MEKKGTELAVCIFADKDTLLTPRKMYQVVPDESAGRSDYVRVIDDEGEDYLYPKKYFIFVSVPGETASIIFEKA
jgi:hypothetical protein